MSEPTSVSFLDEEIETADQVVEWIEHAIQVHRASRSDEQGLLATETLGFIRGLIHETRGITATQEGAAIERYYMWLSKLAAKVRELYPWGELPKIWDFVDHIEGQYFRLRESAEQAEFGRVLECGCLQWRGTSDAKTPGYTTFFYCGEFLGGEHSKVNPSPKEGEVPRSMKDFG